MVGFMIFTHAMRVRSSSGLQNLGCYTVGIAGITVNDLSSDSGGLTPSHLTKSVWVGR